MIKKTILTPPPNVTGSFHLGHFVNLNLSFFLQEILFKMGYEVKTISGWDHAGYSAEKKIDPHRNLPNNVKLHLLRTLSIKCIFKFKQQLKFWDLKFKGPQPIFSLGEDISKLVHSSFYSLKKKNLIKKKNIFIDMLPNGKAASNEEIEIKKCEKDMYTIIYDSIDFKNKKILVSTTLPLTMLADEALVFNPEDIRYKSLEESKVLIPLTNRIIPIKTSKEVKMNIGTGILKLTPSLSSKDYKIAKKIKLSEPFNLNLIDRMGNCTFGFLKGLNWLDAEKILIKKLISGNRIQESYKVIGDSKFSNSYRVMDVKREELILNLKEIVKNIKINELNINPLWCKKDLESWIKKSDTWNLSRDLAWGIKCNRNQVLDTWYNASLWGFLDEIDYLISGCDLIFFWYLKMNAMSFTLNKRPAVKNVFFHGLVCDDIGQKMSKSKGNVIDPKEVIETLGLDESRMMILSSIHQGKIIKFNLKKDEKQGNKVINKLFSIKNFLTRENNRFKVRNTDDLIIEELWRSYLNFNRNFKSAFLKLRLELPFKILEDFTKKFSIFIELYKFESNYSLFNNMKTIFYMLIDNISFLLPNYKKELTQNIKLNIIKFTWKGKRDFKNSLLKIRYLLKDLPHFQIKEIPNFMKEFKILIEVKNHFFITRKCQD